MYPGIEIWDLDVIDAVEPVATLGGYDPEDIDAGRGEEETGGKGKKGNPKKKKGKSKKAEPALRGDSHTDAVLGLSWNAQYRNVLASASADQTVRVWDIATQTSQHVLTHHDGKVQAVEWNPSEPTVLLSGGFDKRAAVVDVRAPEKAAMSWDVGADVECAVWNLGEPTQLLVSNESGGVLCSTPEAVRACPRVHPLAPKATTALSLCPGAPSRPHVLHGQDAQAMGHRGG